ncbi:MAG: hypothetical protein J0M29_13335 [Chitinophagales bacterium]|nr:hypothetical protein [Chitinophagales bacterium]
MKNKMLALSAAVLLMSGIAFGYSKSGITNSCCNMEASTCNGVPCPASGCPVPCCEPGSSTACE